ncbi:glycosyltransferase family 4 protein [Agriterribacter humi]|uniref:glycosyltransferase family 4 protein n=1 Tax=Agriterribacter humi TaxID=1104781 RepID=UPI00126465F2|nr:glycosyltransferase family 4 protein [Agriterribacter humi]
MENNLIEEKKCSGLYIVSETACLNPNTGANNHINAGLSQLQKYFDIKLCLFCKPYKPPTRESSSYPLKSNNTIGSLRGKLKSSIKWIYILLINHVHFFTCLKKVKQASPVFIYERSSYLNFNGIIISKLLRIPHMYEVNGILSHSNSRYFPKFLNKISFELEKKAYRNTFGFYVGGINELLNIPYHNYFIIQNGVDEEFAVKFKARNNVVKDKINLAFIGHVMPHHRLDVLTESLQLLANPFAFRLHLIGSNLESLKDKIPDSVETIFYGSLNHNQISELIKDFHIGVITFALPYFSHVKAFMYGAAKLTMIVPDSRNFKNIFSDNEVVFIKNADAKDMADKLNFLAANPSALEKYGENLYNKIRNKFTWEKIYEEIGCKIDKVIKEYHT